MQPDVEFIPNLNAPFNTYKLLQPQFDFIWHYHPEFEITYVIHGEGRRVVGDSAETFSSGDLILIGSNIPHGYHSDPTGENIEAIGIQFPVSLISDQVLTSESFMNVHKLLKDSRYGLSFSGEATWAMRSDIEAVYQCKGVEKYLALIRLLDKMGEQSEVRHLMKRPFGTTIRNTQTRLDAVIEYVHANLDQRLTIDDMADFMNMTRTSFCRYFKKKTGTTFSNYLNDLRIAKICLELVIGDQRVSELAFNSGFSSLSYFNRVFYAKKGMSPTDYRVHVGRVPVL